MSFAFIEGASRQQPQRLAGVLKRRHQGRRSHGLALLNWNFKAGYDTHLPGRDAAILGYSENIRFFSALQF
jgi:hypothetical protein